MKVPGGQAADQFVRVGLFGIYPQMGLVVEGFHPLPRPATLSFPHLGFQLQLVLGKEGSEVAGLSQGRKKKKRQKSMFILLFFKQIKKKKVCFLLIELQTAAYF